MDAGTMDPTPSQDLDQLFTNGGPYWVPVGRTNMFQAPAPDDFPTITDLRVEPVVRADGMFGVQMRWVSAQYGVVTVFPWWDDLQRDFPLHVRNGIPFGTLDDPFFDADQDWGFQAWQDGVHIYVVHDAGSGWNTWYRVPVAVFEAAWKDGTELIARTIPPPPPQDDPQGWIKRIRSWTRRQKAG
jgi:hypothetical protein